MGMSTFLSDHGFTLYDAVQSRAQSDMALFARLKNTILPDLTDRSKWPFCVLVLNEDTHFPFHVPPECDDYLAKEGYPWRYRSFTCFDHNLRKFMVALEERGLLDDAEVVIYGDHLAMGGTDDLTEDRNLTVFFPLRPQNENWEQARRKQIMTYYDLAPTILNMLNIDYSPPFPFGADIYGPNIGSYPSEDDLKVVYGLATGDPQATNVECHSQHGLCRGNEY
jgi:phosphoglycerol transferase MdoB-like AlkP superfamily enzyme